MATMFSGFTKRAHHPPEVSAAVDHEDEVRSLYDSSWALQHGLLVIESPAPDLLLDEWFVIGARRTALSTS